MTRRASLTDLAERDEAFPYANENSRRHLADVVAQMVLDFWAAVAVLLPDTVE